MKTMSTNLFYRSPKGKDHCCGWQLKYHIAPIIWSHDGTLSSRMEWIEYGSEFWPKNKKIVLGKVLDKLALRKDNVGKEARYLLKLLAKHGGVFLSLIS